MSEHVLELRDVTMQFGGVVAVDSLSLVVNEGEIVALIGPQRRRQDDGVQCRYRRIRPDERRGPLSRQGHGKQFPARENEEAVRQRQQR